MDYPQDYRNPQAGNGVYLSYPLPRPPPPSSRGHHATVSASHFFAEEPTTTGGGGGGRGGGGGNDSQRFLREANEIVITDSERQEGYDTDLLNLQPRTGNNPSSHLQGRVAESPTPSGMSDSTYLSRPNSYDLMNATLIKSHATSSSFDLSVPYTTRAVVFDKEAATDVQAAATQARAGKSGAPGRTKRVRGSVVKSPWWERKLCWLVIVGGLLVVGAGVGVGVGLGLKKHETAVASVAATMTGNDSSNSNSLGGMPDASSSSSLVSGSSNTSAAPIPSSIPGISTSATPEQLSVVATSSTKKRASATNGGISSTGTMSGQYSAKRRWRRHRRGVGSRRATKRE